VTLPAIFSLSKSSRLDKFPGELSYPVYIGHGLIWTLLTYLGLRTGMALMLVTMVFSFGLWFLIDRPIDHLRQKLARSKAVAA
jgi:peptidoglycan/LPS O-acetylase OafA/YrhL